MTRIAILGAGISGLATAYHIKQLSPHAEIKIFEKNNRAGGIIESMMFQDNLFELGARGIRLLPKSKNILNLVKNLGLEDQLVYGNKKIKQRYIYHAGKLRKVPHKILAALFSPVTRHLVKCYFKKRDEQNTPQEESVHQFVSRHFNTKTADIIADALVSGLCAGDAKKVSIHALFPQLIQFQKQNPHLLKSLFKQRKNGLGLGQSGIVSFKQGLSCLTSTLAKTLHNELLLSSKIVRINQEKRGYGIYLADGSFYQADIVVSCLPANILNELTPQFPKEFQSGLAEFEYAPVAVVNLGFKKKSDQFNAFGYLVPHQEKQGILGVYRNDQTFPQFCPSLGTSLTVLIGGTRYQDFDAKNELFFCNEAVRHIQKHFKTKQVPDYQYVKVISKALPQYLLGHEQRVFKIKRFSPPHFFVRGNFIGGLGVSDIVNQSIITAKKIDNILSNDFIDSNVLNLFGTETILSA
ncbi:protoporphyrinogen oxidase [bacterium K02(2017)]|nr:protoporphyrinogen oxidase [bacterium K02(2017)]